MKIMISGSHGLIGSALVNRLNEEGHHVIRLKRAINETLNFEDIDAVVHLAGESIADGRWNDEKKKRIEESRVGGTKKLAHAIASSSKKPSLFICASAIGIYGDRANEELDETSSKGHDFLSTVCTNWEQETIPVKKIGVRTANIRTGMVLDTEGGALSKMLLPFKCGGGGIIGNGQQYMSWISLEDMVSSILFIINNADMSGPINLTAPNPVTNYQFTKTLGAVLKRPTLLPLPAFAARIIFGEMADALLLSSTRVLPKKLTEAGYTFKHDQLKSALEDILK